jgi:hypothetical protein
LTEVLVLRCSRRVVGNGRSGVVHEPCDLRQPIDDPLGYQKGQVERRQPDREDQQHHIEVGRDFVDPTNQLAWPASLLKYSTHILTDPVAIGEIKTRPGNC